MNELQMAGQRSMQKWQETFQQGMQDALKNANEAWLETIREQFPDEIDDVKQKLELLQDAWSAWKDAWQELLDANKEWDESLKKGWQKDFAGPLAYIRLQQAGQACQKVYDEWQDAWMAWQTAWQQAWRENGKKIAAK